MTLDLWLAGLSVFGAGFGSKPIAMGRGGERDYPHNVVLELGLIGMALCLSLLVVSTAVFVRG